jgi:hypothetical protein
MRARTGSAAVWYIFKYDVFVWQYDVFVWQWFHNQERGVREKFFLIKQILIAAVDGKTVFWFPLIPRSSPSLVPSCPRISQSPTI